MSTPISAADLVGRSVSVDVPATTANLGAGFDALALALDLGAVIRVVAVPPSAETRVHVTVIGEGAGQLPTGKSNRFVVALMDGLAEAGIDGTAVG
ncbi:MAG TPA: hypothetical protein VJZ50_04100, partial [Candidatus Limnocylindrales bacterium]|nr:hypothetical protein [Candidatus Limnocylindrales bacterium]